MERGPRLKLIHSTDEPREPFIVDQLLDKYRGQQNGSNDEIWSIWDRLEIIELDLRRAMKFLKNF